MPTERKTALLTPRLQPNETLLRVLNSRTADHKCVLFQVTLYMGIWDSSDRELRQEVLRHSRCRGTWALAEAPASLGPTPTLHGTPSEERPTSGPRMEGGRGSFMV